MGRFPPEVYAQSNELTVTQLSERCGRAATTVRGWINEKRRHHPRLRATRRNGLIFVRKKHWDEFAEAWPLLVAPPASDA